MTARAHLVALALGCATLASAPAVVHGQSQPPIPPAELVVTPASAPTCSPAASACFTGCGEQRARMRSGSCVPLVPPPPSGDYRDLDLILRAGEQAEPQVDTSAADCCMTELRVNLTGWRNLGATATTTAVAWDVRINGQLVGKTPFVDAVPAGRYLVEAVPPNPGVAFSTVVDARGTGVMELSAALELALTPEQSDARTRWRRQRIAAANAQIDASYTALVARWDSEQAPLREHRATNHTWGVISAGGGLVALAGGIALLVLADSADDDATDKATAWWQETSKAERAALAADVSDAETRRDVFAVAGISALLLSAGAFTTSIVLLLRAPTLTERPPAPGHYAKTDSLELRATPGGLVARLRM